MNSNTWIKKYYDVFIPKVQYAKPLPPSGVTRKVFRLSGLVEFWPRLVFEVPKNSGIISDYMSSIIGGRLCSDKLKTIIDDNKNSNDQIQWLPIHIKHVDSDETLTYYHLHFLNPFSGHSKKESMYSPSGDIMKPVWHYSNIKDMEIFTCSEIYKHTMIILSENILKRIEEAECSGMTVKPASVIYD